MLAKSSFRIITYPNVDVISSTTRYGINEIHTKHRLLKKAALLRQPIPYPGPGSNRHGIATTGV